MNEADRDTVTRLESEVARLRLESFYAGNPGVLSHLDVAALQVARELEGETPVVLTEEQRALALRRIRERLATRASVPLAQVEETKSEFLRRKLAGVERVNRTLGMHFGDLCREAGIPVPENPEDFKPVEFLRLVRGEKDTSYIREWAWDSELRRYCDEMRDGLKVNLFGPLYDSDNHDWTMTAVGGESDSPMVKNVVAQSHQPSPTACIRAAYAAYNKIKPVPSKG